LRSARCPSCLLYRSGRQKIPQPDDGIGSVSASDQFGCPQFRLDQYSRQKGIVNNLLLATGIIETPMSLLYSEFAITIGSIYLFLPLMVITLVGIIENIDTEIMEAAETLGANRLTAFLKVILPLSVPASSWAAFSSSQVP
jgi:hypothetical protein